MFWRNVGRRPLWREMERFQREMNRVMDRYTPTSTAGFPPLNVWANEEHALLTAEIPGVEADDLEISIVGDTITLSGERLLAETGEDVRYHRHERWHGSFSRTMQLPFRIDVDGVEAQFRNGVLEVTLPRAAEDKPKKISVGGDGADGSE